MNALSYLIQVNLYLLLFYLFYLVMLRNETFFKMNRFYLVGSALCSLIIPAMKTDWIKDLFITEKVQEFTQTVKYSVITPGIDQLNTQPLIVQTQPWLTTTEWIWLTYAAVSLVFLINFLRKLYFVNAAFKLKLQGRAFSFFSKIAVDEELEGKETIVKHEQVHARQWHSADLIFFELFLALNWFNPIVYLYRKAIKNIHEFIADDSAASTLEDRSAYALLLVSNVFNTQPQQLTNNFFNQSLLKRRIIMLHKTKSRKVAILKYGLSAPLFALMIIFSSATGADANIIRTIAKKIQPVEVKLTNNELNTVEDLLLTIKAEPPVKKKNKKRNVLAKENFKSNPTNLKDYTWNYNSSVYNENFKEGLLLISFEVDEAKKAGNFKITKSDNFKWQDDYLTYLNKFNDTVALEKGTHYFYKGYIYAGNEDKFPSSSVLMGGEYKILFVGFTSLLPAFIAKDETKEESGKIVNYISKTPLTDPVIVVDGKEATYKKAEMGFKLDETIYPKTVKTIRVFKGDEAVANHNESARKGLILITTKPPEPEK
ncbi:MAG TPA: M56 family metallopeptidase [Pedobacter sp.]|nr:M56 family metallopeptidase [Pedobacter sp.]